MKLTMSSTQHHFTFGIPMAHWPVLLMLLLSALLPSACVIWFMNTAIDNQQLAMKQRLTDIYQDQLAQVQDQIQSFWQGQAEALNHADVTKPAVAFSQLIEADIADAIVVLDEQGHALFPQRSKTLVADSTLSDGDATKMSRHEITGQYPQAIESYRMAYSSTKDRHVRALLLRSIARSQSKANLKTDAVQTLGELIDNLEFVDAHDHMGRLIRADAMLRIMQLLEELGKHNQVNWKYKELLVELLNDFSQPLPPSQRLFLMSQLADQNADRFKTYHPLHLAHQLLNQDWQSVESDQLIGNHQSGYVILRSENKRVLAIYSPQSIDRLMSAHLPSQSQLTGAVISVADRPLKRDPGALLLSHPLGGMFPGWQISLYDTNSDLLSDEATRQKELYLGAGVAVIGLIVILALAMTAYISRSMRLTRLKNDLIATVSHELKTPLASMRVLVDTLRQGRCDDPVQRQEYFELIARENQRLTRLIDNFLTFSRMERNKQAFDFLPVTVGEIVTDAMQCVQDRFESPDTNLQLEMTDEVKQLVIHADRDAMVTVLLNLLDNAWKYSGDHKQVTVRAMICNDKVFIAVKDNGMGLSRRAQSHIFDRFYQVDQSLSRQVGGCGLGLSIVRFIVDAHGGTITVDSQPGAGSTFTLQLQAQSDGSTTCREV